MAAEKHSLVRTIYLYLFTIIGLVLLVIGSVSFLDMALKAFVFKQAEAPERLQQQYSCLYSYSIPIEKLEQNQTSTSLTADEQATLKTFLENYKDCQEQSVGINYISAQRQRDASRNLAMILVGLPLYLYHWRTIARETKKREEEDKAQN
ncbi:MAG: hypothetical protein V1756_00475 [Patescibacteria group bacterium]